MLLTVECEESVVMTHLLTNFSTENKCLSLNIFYPF